MSEERIAILGVDESDDLGRASGQSNLQLAAQAIKNALRDAGLSLSDVDGLFTCGFGWAPTLAVGEFVGLQPRYMDSTSVGGCSFIIDLEHASAAIRQGLCDVALIVHGEHGYSRRNFNDDGDAIFPFYPNGQFVQPFGISIPIGEYAMLASRHMAQYGTTGEQLAEIAVATRKWAKLNPKALMKQDLTIDEIMSSPYICYPLHRADICLVTDAAGAVIVARADRVKSARKSPVWILGTGEASSHHDILGMPDYTTTPVKQAGERAFGRAGIRPEEVDLAMIYDAFTSMALVEIEDLGFCKPGEGGAFVSNQRTAPGGDFPMNTNGGGLSYTHPGMYGIFTIIEAVRQLRGECGERQVKDCKLAVTAGPGGFFSAGGVAVLASD